MQPEHRPPTDAPTRVQTKHIRASHGRRVLLYITHTQSRDIASRLEHVLGIRVATRKADTVATDAREDWVNRRVREA